MARGYCGPFVNGDFYGGLDAAWAGMAECYHCGSTVHAPTELEKWERALSSGEGPPREGEERGRGPRPRTREGPPAGDAYPWS